MSDRIVYLGPFNNKKKDDLINKALKSLKSKDGDKFYYLLPNGELLTDYRRKFINHVEKSFEINLFTFDNVVKDILRDEIYLTINDAMKDLIIKKVINKLKDEGKIIYYKDFISMEGFIETLSSIIGEIKRSLVYPKDYLNNCPSKINYKEIGLIYSGYENCLDELNLLDREAAYFKAIEKLKNNNNYFNNLDYIIIDEFYDFRPIEIDIIKELCKSNIDIYINIPFDMKSKLSTIKDTIETLSGLKFDIEYIEKDEMTDFELIGYNFFNEETISLEYNNNLTLINSPSIYIELKRIFEEIKRLHRDGRELNRMSIVLLNEEYKDILFEVAKEENTPISLQKEVPLIEIPLIKEFLNIIDTKVSNLSKTTVVNRIKSHYFNIVDNELKDKLEFILRKLNFSNLDELIGLFANENSLNISADSIEPISEVIDIILDEMKLIADSNSVLNYNSIFKARIEYYCLNDKIADRYSKDKDFNLFYRDKSALEKLHEIIDSMEQISMLMAEISIEDYYEALTRLIQDETVLDQDGNLNGVKIFNLINSRGFNHDIVFITGLSEQQYPVIQRNDFFINDDNCHELRKIGLDYKNYHERLNNEAIKFAALISSCIDRAYLSYSGDSTETSLPSMFLDEVLSMFNGENTEEKIQSIDIDIDYLLKDSIENITTIEELSNYLVLNHHNDMSNQSLGYFSLHNSIDGKRFEDINHKVFSEYKRHEETFNEYSGMISDELIIQDIKELLKDKVYSNTYLEAYGRCPYYFLLSNLLNVEEMERSFEEYSPMDVGNIYHDVLRHYYHAYKEDISKHVAGEKLFLVEDSLDYLMELVETYSRNHDLNSQNKHSQLIIENTYDRLREFIEKDIIRITNSSEKLVPHSFEVEFGGYNKFILDLDNGKIEIRGKIDRIDKILGEDKYTIMDYKSSSYGIYDVDSMEKGISLQLPIYILSQEDKKVVAGLYGIIANGDFEVKLGLLEETKMINSRNKGALDTEEWDKLMETTKANINRFVTGMFNGDFSVNPMECSPYCIYKDICRYEEQLEVE
ncbi:PD-(D/E)XK nuclease family protein [Tissierella sp.]|uniref:PD-(D/E)XK nuclease family protein n=1 Tax=Tissierella sp. TaxID=41274 RepID=UPI002859052B|nr:PD-(D/E)XK nuclease family protein [Tissierella sp.]MDR7857269.1 PD-(D/E)XK nuclease family protein [Tissierella sp.]